LKPTPTRVLIIDDDPLIRTLLVSTLKKDCLVAVAAEGSEGFHKALELTPDVAVIDVNMPGWDGLKTLEAFRAHPGLKSIKVIMLTADASKQTVMAAIHGGAHDYLIKTNFSKADFYRKLNRLVPGSIAEVPPLSLSAGADFDDAPTSVSPTNPHADLSIGARDPSIVSSRQDLGQPAWAAPSLAAATVSANAESRLQELIDGWE
jgi:CheY-like chemotaxis protein